MKKLGMKLYWGIIWIWLWSVWIALANHILYLILILFGLPPSLDAWNADQREDAAYYVARKYGARP